MEASLLAREALKNAMTPAAARPLRMVDFLSLVLSSHGKALQKLGEWIGPEALTELMESVPEESTLPPRGRSLLADEALALWQAPGMGSPSQQQPLLMLESAVSETRLPAHLEFYVWAYPYYRSWIEGPVALDWTLKSSGDLLENLARDAAKASEEWLRTLPLNPDLSEKALKLISPIWIRFRSDLLKTSGKRTLQAI